MMMTPQNKTSSVGRKRPASVKLLVLLLAGQRTLCFLVVGPSRWRLTTASRLRLTAPLQRQCDRLSNLVVSAVASPPSDSTASKSLAPSGTLLALPFGELAERIGGSGRARMVWGSLKEGLSPFEDEAITSRARAELRAAFEPLSLNITEAPAAACGTRKFLLQLHDGLAVETVTIPSHSGARTTACISSQVGCARACTFCQTGKMGLIRSLSAEEILAQVFAARRVAREAGMAPLTNLVFMGMGEPLALPSSVLAAALKQLTDPLTFGFGRGHISVSTVGPSPNAIRSLAGLPCRIAWSAHAGDDAVRRRLVPTTAHPMTELRDAFSEVLRERPGEHLFVEATLIEGLNDSPEAAAALGKVLAPLPGRTRVNLLPYNDIGHPTHRPSPPENVKNFQLLLQDAGFVTTVRTARGAADSAACGQLATAWPARQ